MKQLHPCQVLLDTDTNKSRYYEIHLGKGEDLAGEILCCVASCFLFKKFWIQRSKEMLELTVARQHSL